MFNGRPTRYDTINQVITALVRGIIDILGSEVVGSYLFGSLTYGDFNEQSSDIDLVTITKRPVTELEIAKLQKLHRQIEDQYPEWAQRIESSYTPQTMLPSIAPPGARPYYGEGIFYPAAEYGNEWIINLHLLYHHGVAIVGPAFTQLLPAVSIRDVQQACVRDLFKEWVPKLAAPEWLNNSHYQSYLVLNLCRILNTVVNATTLSKPQSAAWVKQAYPQWATLITTAEQWHYGIEMTEQQQALAFLRFVIAKVKEQADPMLK